MNDFTQAIQTAILLFPIVALFFTIPYVLHQYHKYGSINSWRTVIIYSFILYLMSAYFLVILPLPSKEFVQNMSTPRYNLEPFLFLKKIFTDIGLDLSDFATYFPTLKNAVVYEAIFNTFLTVPFGVYLHYYFKCNFSKTLFYSFCLTLFFELTQLSGLYFIYPRGYRVFDIDDLILNTLGGVLGYFLGSIFLKIFPSRDEIDEKSYQKGQSVSLLRRITVFLLDLTIIFLLTFSWGIVIYQTPLTKEWIILPLIFSILLIIIFKRTIGMRFLRLKFQPSDPKKTVKWYQVFFYYFFFFIEYFILPVCLILLTIYGYSIQYIDTITYQYILVVILALWGMVFIISFLKRIFHMPMFYESVSKLELASTIKIRNE